MPSQRTVSRKWVALAAITLLAAFLRFHRIWTLPPGEIVRDTYTLQVPEDAPAGVYNLQMGFYVGSLETP